MYSSTALELMDFPPLNAYSTLQLVYLHVFTAVGFVFQVQVTVNTKTLKELKDEMSKCLKCMYIYFSL